MSAEFWQGVFFSVGMFAGMVIGVLSTLDYVQTFGKKPETFDEYRQRRRDDGC